MVLPANFRLRDTIDLQSPDGSTFKAKWIGNSRSLEKKIGLFNFPKVKGTKGQDLEVNGDRYPLTIYFDQIDHDLESNKFWKSLKEKGKWGITHPLYGFFSLQLLSATQDIQIVTSQSHTVFKTEWIETLPDGSEISAQQLSGGISAQGILANISAAQQYVDNARRETFGQVAAIASSVNSVVNAVKKNIRRFENFNIVPPGVDAVIRSIGTTLDSVPPNVENLAGQVQNLIQLNVLAQNNIISAFDNFISFSEDLLTILPDVPTEAGINVASTQELALSATVSAMAQSSLLPGIESRVQAVELALSIVSFFDVITNKLDESQELYSSNPIDAQFFSQSASYSESYKLVALVAQYLLIDATNLKIEKRFKTKIPRNFIEICADEYGAIDDSTLDFFISTNKLDKNEIRIIPALREMVVFV